MLGNGIDVCYPRENTVVQQKIARFGCLVSEYPPGTPPLAYHFPQRNRLMAALGRAVAVVEAREKSGAMITVNLALELGRDVFCMPGDIGRDSCKGNLALLREGAYVFTSAQDILNEYRSEFKDTIQIERADVPYGEGVAAMWMFISNKMAEQESKTPAPQRCASPALTPDTAYSPVPEAGHAANAGAPLASAPQTPPAVQTLPEECSASAVQVYRVLDSTPRQFDEIVNNTSLPASIVLRALTELQIGGYIKTYAGRRFSL